MFGRGAISGHLNGMAIGGAVIGSLLLPGVGTVVGGAIGGALSGHQEGSVAEAVLDDYHRAFGQVSVTAQAIFGAFWDRLAGYTERNGGPHLPQTARLVAADEELTEAANRLSSDEEWRAFAELFLDRHGPHPAAIRVMALYGVLHGPEADARSWADTLSRLYPDDPVAAECQARLRLAAADYAGAVEAAAGGLAAAPDAIGLLEVRAEGLAAAGRSGQVDTAAWPADQGGLWLAYARGACRAGDLAGAGSAIRAWAAAGADLLAVARVLQADPVVATHFVSLTSTVPGLAPFVVGATDELAAIVRTCLPADDRTTFYGQPPGDRGRLMRERILRSDPARVLYFADRSWWDDGKIGLSVTVNQVAWRAT